MKLAVKEWIWILAVTFFSVLMIRISLNYLHFDPHEKFMATKLNVVHLDHWRLGFYLHVFSSFLLLLAGITQFSTYVLRNYPVVHRTMGWTYILIILFISGPGGMAMGIHANGGLPAKTSFVILTTLWMVFTAISWYAVRKKDYRKHGEFLLRSYSLTFSAITLRIYAFIFAWAKWDFRPTEVYVTIAWLSWVPNLIIAEIMIRNGFIDKLLKKRRT